MSDRVAFTWARRRIFPSHVHIVHAIYAYPPIFPWRVIAAVLILSTVPPVFLQAESVAGRSYAVAERRTKPCALQFSPWWWVTWRTAFYVFVLGLPLLGRSQLLPHTATLTTRASLGCSPTRRFAPLPSFTTRPPCETSNQLGIWVAVHLVLLRPGASHASRTRIGNESPTSLLVRLPFRHRVRRRYIFLLPDFITRTSWISTRRSLLSWLIAPQFHPAGSDGTR